jgi:lysophospholipase L1-like esterase
MPSDNLHGNSSGPRSREFKNALEAERPALAAHDRAAVDVKAAFSKGRAIAGELVSTRSMQARFRRAAPQGLVVGLGDSWFDSPGADILSSLEDLGYEVESIAHCGETLENLAFNGGLLGDFHRLLARVKQKGETPSAILLGGGSNDLAGEEFPALLNHASSGLPALNPVVLGGLVDCRLKAALAHWIGAVDTAARGVFGLPLKIVIHGYDYPVPDGRATNLGGPTARRPALRPAFWSKGHTNLQRNRGVVRELVNRLNDMQTSLVEELELPNLVHVDLRNTLSAVLYENDWDTELAPTESGFLALARRMAAAIQPAEGGRDKI